MATCGGVSNHIQVCYDIIGRDTGGFTVRFYVNTVGWGWNDDQVLSVSGSNGTSGSWGYHASASSGQSKTLFQVDVGFPLPPGGCASFSASVSGIAGGGSPSVSGSDCAYCGTPNPPSIGWTNVSSTNLGVYTTAAGAENGCTTDTVNYRLHRSRDGAHMGDIQGGYGGVNFGGLEPGQGYYAYAQSHNAAGWGGWSGAISGSTSAAPPNPPGIASRNVTATGVEIYTASPGAENGATTDIVNYRVQRTSDGAMMGDKTAGYNPGATWTNLVRNTAYTAFAQSHNAAGWGGWSAGISFTTLPSVPSAPTITSITSITPTSAVVSWSPPADNGGQTVTSYGVQYSRFADFSDNLPLQPTGTLTGLTPGATYWVRVRAGNASGSGPWSNVVSFTTQTGMKVYNGTSFVDAPVYVYNGTTWDACEVRIYNGTAWVPTG